MILRLLLIAIAIVILLRLLGWKPPLGRSSARNSDPELEGRVAPHPDQKVDADLVICARCGLSVSRLSGFSHAGRWACCIEHLDHHS
jgi:hypothetical protein